MKKNLIRSGLMALGLCLALPAGGAKAQEFNSVYVTPRLIYSYQYGDMKSNKWSGAAPFSASVLGGEENDKVFGLGVAVGTDLSYTTTYPVRVEAEYIYHGKGEFKKSESFFTGGNYYSASQKFEVTAHSIMANAFYDFNTNSAFTPYVGGGLGLAYLKTDYRTNMHNGDSGSATMSKKDWNLAWNIGGGFAYYLNDSTALDFGYRYMDLGTADAGNFNVSNMGYSGSASMDYTAHEFSVGVRFSGF
ncbi:outer membrane beta-barrel protein [Deltaproteobacteria bacterium OttesenSCG-928-K17]|nr:outer membrane beta-barrel protein [Deltaproteobacteria bacterium OttesenSCG-928-K17]